MHATTFITIHQLAEATGLPRAWLRREAEAGRIPSLRAGRQLKFDREAVERALSERAEQQAEGREAQA